MTSRLEITCGKEQDLFALSVWVRTEDRGHVYVRKTLEVPADQIPSVVRAYCENADAALRDWWGYVPPEPRKPEPPPTIDWDDLDLEI